MNTEPKWMIEVYNEQNDEYTYRICNDDLLNIGIKVCGSSLHIYANGELINQSNLYDGDDDDVHNIKIHCSSRTDYMYYLIGTKDGHIRDVSTFKALHLYGEHNYHTDTNSIYDTIYKGYLIEYFIDNDMEYYYHMEILNKVEFALDMKPKLLEYFNGTKHLNPIILQLPHIIV